MSRHGTGKPVRFGGDPTYLGEVTEVSGAEASVRLAPSVASGLSIIAGRTYRIGQVGSFVRIPQGYQDMFGVVAKVGESAVPGSAATSHADGGRWMMVQLVGESIAGHFERGISQHPNVGDAVQLAVEDSLRRIYGASGDGYITIGSLSSAESIPAKISLDGLVTRHSAVLGSTGSGKSTTIASLLRAITAPPAGEPRYPSARILLLDVHGEYSLPLADVAQVYSVDPRAGEEALYIPYWALGSAELLDFVADGPQGNQGVAFTDKMFSLKQQSEAAQDLLGSDASSMTVDTPIPFSLKQLWYELLDFEVKTFQEDRETPMRIAAGDPDTLAPPRYERAAMGPKGPFLNQQAVGIQRQLSLLRSRLLDRRYDFLLHPGPWEPDLEGRPEKDLDQLLAGWIGGRPPLTILDLSGVPSIVLEQLVGSILRIVYESLFWSRERTEGGIERPLLIAMEEAHRYLSAEHGGLALTTARTIAKEGRKYGVGAMVISQRPSEIDETILSQCGTFFALRLGNPEDRARVRGALPEGLATLLDTLPVLRTGEAVVIGEATRLPMRCRVTLPAEAHRPRSQDPRVSEQWQLDRLDSEGYDRVAASWRAQRPRIATIDRDKMQPVTD